MGRTLSLLLSGLIFVCVRGATLDEGSSCSLQDGRPGSCKRLKDCAPALEELQQKKRPTTCTFDKMQPVVCCPQAPTSISLKKCEEYSQYVFVQESSSWVPGSPSVNRSRCAAVSAGAIFVLGGEDAAPREFPHMALIGYGEKDRIVWGCGGSLISDQFVLTAAHCASKQGSPVGWVLLGDLVINTDNDKSRPQLLGISSVELNPEYSPGFRYNDIMLLKLDKKAELNEFVRPACLHLSTDVGVDKGIASGWGVTNNEDNTMSNALMKVVLPLRRTEECTQVYTNLRDKHQTKTGYDQDSMLCIGDPERPKDTCKGDSGGPFQSVMKKPYCMYEIIGVTSFGLSHCGSSIPAVYTRVSKFVPWIESVVWPSG